MTTEVSPQVLAAFHQFDSDGNGMIDAAELAGVLKRLDAKTFDDEKCKVLFEAADADMDGLVDLQEFITWLFKDPNAQKVLDALDRDRMTRMGTLLLSIDLPWMKENVDQSAFNLAVLSIVRKDGTTELEADIFTVDADANTLPMAHALLSVEASQVPASVRLAARGDDVVLKDASCAPLLYSALAAGCSQLEVINAEWGERTLAACESALPEAKVTKLSLAFARITEEEAVMRIMDSIDEESTLESMDLSNNTVGLQGLAAVHEAVKRCLAINTVLLYNIGPWLEGDGLGCRRKAEDEDVVLLEALRDTLKSRGGRIQNEAFNDGDVCDYSTKIDS